MFDCLNLCDIWHQVESMLARPIHMGIGAIQNFTQFLGLRFLYLFQEE